MRQKCKSIDRFSDLLFQQFAARRIGSQNEKKKALTIYRAVKDSVGKCASTAGKLFTSIIGHAELDAKVNHYRDDEINIYGCGEIHRCERYSYPCTEMPTR